MRYLSSMRRGTRYAPPWGTFVISLRALTVSCGEALIEGVLPEEAGEEELLRRVRQRATASTHWSLDFRRLVRGSAALRSPPRSPQPHIFDKVGTTLASVLRSSDAPSIESLAVSLPSPEAALAVQRLCMSTPLLTSLRSLRFTLEATAETARQSSEGGIGGHEVARLLQTLAQHQHRAAGQSRLTSLSIESCDTSAPAASPLSQGPHPRLHAAGHLWDDITVEAAAALIATTAWARVEIRHVDLTVCSARARGLLWAAFDRSHDSLTHLSLAGMRHACEFVSSGQLSHLPRLVSLEMGDARLEEAAVLRLLKDVQQGLGGWWRLQHLGLAQCEVTETAIAVLAQQLQALEAKSATEEEEPALESLAVSGSCLSRHAAFTLAGCLLRCTAVRELHTRNCQLHPSSLEDIAAALRRATALQLWELPLNRFGDEGAAVLACYAQHWPALTELDLSGCRLTSASLPALSRALPAWDRLRTLRLAGNDLRRRPAPTSSLDGQETGPLFAYDRGYMRTHGGSAKVPTSYELERRDRAEGRQRYRGVEEIAQEGAATGVPPMVAFGEALSMSSALRQLDLSDCSLTDAQLMQLGTRFAGVALEELGLAANPLFTSVQGLDALVELLWRTPRLTVLDVSFTNLGDLGVSMLCDGAAAEGGGGGVLRSLSALHRLQLSGCGIESLGWESLAAVAAHLPSLRHIALQHNRASEAALLVELLGQLGVVQGMQSVNLTHCTDSPDVVAQVSCSVECRALRRRGVRVLL